VKLVIIYGAGAPVVWATGSATIPFTVTSTASAMPGDFNSDGHVDVGDFSGVNGWQDRFGVDLDGDDLLSWQRNLGAQSAPAPPIHSVSEPTTLLLMIVGRPEFAA
jgi:hypothetical protein